MPTYASRIRPSLLAEWSAAADAEARGDADTAFEHLQRAHVLGQRATLLHVRTHWLMLCFAVRTGRGAEARGQLWRVVAAALFTPLGLVPEGNTGGSDVSGLRRMPVAPDLRQAIDAARA